MVQEKNWDNHVTCSSIDLSANAVKKKKKKGLYLGAKVSI